MDPLSLLAAEEEAKIIQAQKAREAAEVAAAQISSKTRMRNHFEEEENRLESITRIHLHDPNIDINSNIKEIEIKDRTKITKKKWINSFCVVNFDLEIGQTLDYSYPKVSLRDEEITNLCFLSFPDSNSHLQGDIIYSFKLKYYNQEESNYSFQYGYVFFRQEKDPSIPRGYLQKSVVLLSDEPFVGLFKKVIEVVGPLYFQYGNTLLEVAHQNMAAWPELKLGQTYELPILGSIFTFHVPYTTGAPHIIDPILKQNLAAMKDKSQVSVSNLQSIDLFTCFKSFSSKLWMLWEMVLLGHPIIVMSPTPPNSSDAVLALVSLISPLNYCGDFRPYFTIHDPDFQKYTSTSSANSSDESSNIPASIIGVTNPFFLKALGHWPTIINIGTVQRLGNQQNMQNQLKKKTLTSMMSRDTNVLDNKEKITTDYKPYTSPDKNLVKKITDGGDNDPTHNETLRKYFLQLTLSFLIPLERYFSSLLPLAKTISVFQRPPRLKNFDNQEFIDKMSETDETYIIDSKSREIELYKEFLESVNFKNWLEEKRKEAIRHLNTLYRRAILEADIHTLLKHKNQSTALDLYKRVKDQLILEENLFQAPDDIKQKLKAHLDLILPYLPQ